MSTKAITRYFAFLLALLAGSTVFSMLKDLFAGTGTHWNIFYLFLGIGLFYAARQLVALRRWALIVFTLLCALCAHETANLSYTLACLHLAHTVAGALVLFFRWRELKSGF